jgi:hypothetical protein
MGYVKRLLIAIDQLGNAAAMVLFLSVVSKQEQVR